MSWIFVKQWPLKRQKLRKVNEWKFKSRLVRGEKRKKWKKYKAKCSTIINGVCDLQPLVLACFS